MKRVGSYHIPATRRTGEPALDLLAAVVRLAVEDARHGDPAALQWLFEFAPDWCLRAELPLPPAVQGELFA